MELKMHRQRIYRSTNAIHPKFVPRVSCMHTTHLAVVLLIYKASSRLERHFCMWHVASTNQNPWLFIVRPIVDGAAAPWPGQIIGFGAAKLPTPGHIRSAKLPCPLIILGQRSWPVIVSLSSPAFIIHSQSAKLIWSTWPNSSWHIQLFQ